MSAAKPAVGIDLGTTFSAVARLDETGRPVTLPNAEGDLTTPSVVLFDGDDVVVGKEAVKALGTEAEHVALCPKRDMGSRFFSKAIDGKQYAPEVIQAYVLRKVVSDARRQIGDFQQVVITVPAYFDEVRRKATQDAGYMAGLEVLDIINEPTAAAIAFGFQQGFLSPQGAAHAAQNILVYDLGGGTFDVTVMELKGTEFRTLSIDGDVQLGGRDWDERLVRFVSEEFIRQHDVDPRHDPNALGRLWRDCEDAKRTLSARKKAAISCDMHGRSVRLEITRDQFCELTRDLLERTQFTSRQAIKAAGLDWGSIARVLLVGGSTRMPMVLEMLTQLTGKPPDGSVSADEAVAHGAALRAGLILGENAGRPASFQIKNVNSHSLGVVGTDKQTGRKRNAVVIPRNTPLPVIARRIFKTQQASQKTVLVPIVEGESPSADACTAIGQCVIRDMPPNLPAGTPIDVQFRYGTDGRLTVQVKVADAATQLTHEIHRENGLSPQDLDIWRSRVDGMKTV
jgi:molecular chaperone DnaK